MVFYRILFHGYFFACERSEGVYLLIVLLTSQVNCFTPGLFLTNRPHLVTKPDTLPRKGQTCILIVVSTNRHTECQKNPFYDGVIEKSLLTLTWQAWTKYRIKMKSVVSKQTLIVLVLMEKCLQKLGQS